MVRHRTRDAERQSLADEQRSLGRERILAAAREVLADRGLHATAEDIAEAAHVSVRTVFRYFASRDSLVAAAVRSSLDTSKQRWPHTAEATDLDSWLHAVLEEARRRDDLGRAYWDMAMNADIGAEIRAAYDERRAARAKLVRWATKGAWRLCGGNGAPPAWLTDAFALHLSPLFGQALSAETGRSSDAVLAASTRVLAAAARSATVATTEPTGNEEAQRR